MGKTVNLFVVESRFQALVALMIAKSQPDSDNSLFYFDEAIGDFTGRFPFVHSVYLGTACTTGLWKKPRTLKRRVNTLIAAAKTCEPLEHIHYYCANLKTPLLNYPIHALQVHFPRATLSVNILTDGTSNFQRRNLSDKAQRKLQTLARRPIHRLLGLHFTLFNRERFGIDADLVRRIYLLPGAPHNYDHDNNYADSRVVDVPIVDLGLPSIANDQGTPRALVIGEKLTERHWLSSADEQRISTDIASLIRSSGITDIDYVPHPTASQLDLWQAHYTRVTTQDPIELRIMQHHYTLICGIASTALFTARLLQRDDGRTVSVGLHCLAGRNALAEKIGEAFVGMGVEIIE